MKSLELLGNRLSIMLKQSHIETGGKAVNTTLILCPALVGTWVCQHAARVKHSPRSLQLMKHTALLFMDSPNFNPVGSPCNWESHLVKVKTGIYWVLNTWQALFCYLYNKLKMLLLISPFITGNSHRFLDATQDLLRCNLGERGGIWEYAFVKLQRCP